MTLAQAQADMDVVANNLAAAFPVADKETGVRLVSIKEDIVGNVRPFLIVLVAGAGFLLLIACANVANLLLARSMARSREFAVRVAIGAGQWRVLRQLLVESALLAGVGGALGLLLAAVAVNAAVKVLPAALPRVEEISLDGRVLFFTLAVSALAAIISGAAPALHSSKANLSAILKEAGRGAPGPRRRMQKALATARSLWPWRCSSAQG